MYQDNVMLLQPTIIALRIFGLCPSAIRRYRIPTSNKILAVVLLLIPLFGTPSEILNIQSTFYDITAFIFYVNLCVVFVIAHSYFLISAFTSCKTLTRFFMTMESAQKGLHNLNIRQPYNPSKMSQIVWLFLILGPFTMLAIYSIPSKGFKMIIYSVIFIVKAGTSFKIRVLLDLVKSKLILLNWHLDNLNNRRPLYLPLHSDESFGELTSVPKYQENMFVQDNLDNRKLSPEKIKDFNKTNLKLFYAFKTLNSAYGSTVFALIVSECISFIGDTYRCFISYNSGHAVDVTAMLSLPITVYSHIMLVMTLLTLGTEVHEQGYYVINTITQPTYILHSVQSRRTALLVHDLLDEDHHSPQIQHELETFSMALLERKANFSAAGFFMMDLKLVSRMASFMAPIILFLIQNNNQPHSQRRHPSS